MKPYKYLHRLNINIRVIPAFMLIAAILFTTSCGPAAPLKNGGAEAQVNNPAHTQVNNSAQTYSENPAPTQANSSVPAQVNNPVQTYSENPVSAQVNSSTRAQLENPARAQVNNSAQTYSENLAPTTGGGGSAEPAVTSSVTPTASAAIPGVSAIAPGASAAVSSEAPGASAAVPGALNPGSGGMRATGGGTASKLPDPSFFTHSSTAAQAPDGVIFSSPVHSSSGGYMRNNRFEIAYISDFGLLGDESVSQATWEGITRYARENNISAKHYAPEDYSVDAYLEIIKVAVRSGAKIVVASGVLSEVPVWQAQHFYPDIIFILVDGSPHNEDYTSEKMNANVAALRFNSSEAGFLAGYSAVKAGYRSLGFIGAMPTPEIADTGLGFIQGAEYAAGELGLMEGGVALRYTYYGTFLADPGAQFLALEWFGAEAPLLESAGMPVWDDDDTASAEALHSGSADDRGGAGDAGGGNAEGVNGGGNDDGENNDGGVDGGGTDEESIHAGMNAAMPGEFAEFIYAAGGELEYRVALAAAMARKPVALFENPNARRLSSVIAAVEKNYADAVYECISKYYDGKFPGGEFIMYGAVNNGVGLRFRNEDAPLISRSDYTRITSMLAAGAIKITRASKYPYAPPALSELPVHIVAVTEE